MPIVSWDQAKGGSLSSGRQGAKRTKKKELQGTRADRSTRSDVTFTRDWGEEEQRKVKALLSFSLFLFVFSLFFCTSANLGKGIRYESNGVARNELTRCTVSRFAGCSLCLAPFKV